MAFKNIKLKSDKVNITNLIPILKNRLSLLAKLHKDETGYDLMITSGNDSTHSYNSKHYTNEAIDFRRWNYDKMLDKENKIEFMSKLYTIFPKQLFDIVLERDHFHLEFDPETAKENPEIRQPKKQKQEIPVKEKKPIPDSEIKPNINVSLLNKIDYDSTIKGLINFIFNRLTGFRIFKSIKNKSKSLTDYLIELIKLIIQKIKGKEK